MAYSSGSESEVCFNFKCKYDLDQYKTECAEQKAKIRDYEVESIAFENALRKVEKQLAKSYKNHYAFEEKVNALNVDLEEKRKQIACLKKEDKDKDEMIVILKKALDKEKKLIYSWQNSRKDNEKLS